MWPWGHLAVGYLLYSAIARRRDRPPDSRATLLVLFGTQLPDLVDKPLAWAGILPSGRTLAHTLIVVVPLSVVVYLYASRHGRSSDALAFGVGYISHPLVDGFKPLIVGEYQYVHYLLWPLFGLDLPSYTVSRFVVIEPFELLLGWEPVDLDITLYGLAQFTLLVFAILVWSRDGAPGLDELGERTGK